MRRLNRLALVFSSSVLILTAVATTATTGRGQTATRMIDPRIPISSLPFTISKAGSYIVTRNLKGTSGRHGILVKTDNVTINLNGFMLIGVPGSLDGIHVSANGTKSIHVKNGTIRGWGDNGLDGDDNTTADHLVVIAITPAAIRLGEHGTIRKSKIMGATVALEAGQGLLITETNVSGSVTTGPSLHAVQLCVDLSGSQTFWIDILSTLAQVLVEMDASSTVVIGDFSTVHHSRFVVSDPGTGITPIQIGSGVHFTGGQFILGDGNTLTNLVSIGDRTRVSASQFVIGDNNDVSTLLSLGTASSFVDNSVITPAGIPIAALKSDACSIQGNDFQFVFDAASPPSVPYLSISSEGNVIADNRMLGVAEGSTGIHLVLGGDGNDLRGNVIVGDGSGAFTAFDIDADRNQVVGNTVGQLMNGTAFADSGSDNVIGPTITSANVASATNPLFNSIH